MPPPRLRKSRKRFDCLVSACIPAAQAEQLAACASALNVSVSSLVREAIVREIPRLTMRASAERRRQADAVTDINKATDHLIDCKGGDGSGGRRGPKGIPPSDDHA